MALLTFFYLLQTTSKSKKTKLQIDTTHTNSNRKRKIQTTADNQPDPKKFNSIVVANVIEEVSE